jgi:saccharopine dehydrogenase (NAD+, L-lysine-forming)
MPKKILILGGYGGVGCSLSALLLKETDAVITIAGRNPEKGKALVEQLQQQFPGRSIYSVFANCSRKESLQEAFQGQDLIILTTTTPEWAKLIAETAIEAGADYMDILLRPDVVDNLQLLEPIAKEKGRVIITQGGFHPGLIAPLIKYAAPYFDEYHTAEVSMAMNAKFRQSGSAVELIYETGQTKPSFLKDGVWKIPTYKDVIRVNFSPFFGTKDCFPLYMRELTPLQSDLGIRNMGCYAAGFNWFVDYLIFPLIMLFQSIKKGLAMGFLSWLLVKSINFFYKDPPGVELRLAAHGKKNGKDVRVGICLFTDDAYDVTSMAVIACLNQYFQGHLNAPGLHLMGNAVEPVRVFEDLKQMGVSMEVVVK